MCVCFCVYVRVGACLHGQVWLTPEIPSHLKDTLKMPDWCHKAQTTFIGHDSSKTTGLLYTSTVYRMDCLVGLMLKTSASRAADLGFSSRFLHGDFVGLSHIGDLEIGTSVATLPGTWLYRVSVGTGWPGVSIP